MDVEGERAAHWASEPCYEAVPRTFADRPGARIIRGPIPETLHHVTATKVAFRSIDMKSVAPEVATFWVFWPWMPSGAIVLLVDYGWAGHEPQRDAFNALSAEFGFIILSLPTGHAVIVK